MSDPILNFEEHRRRREDNPSVVPCARCGKSIVATVTRCPECGVHFQREAQFFIPSTHSPSESSGALLRGVVIAAVFLAALFYALILFG